MGLRIAVYVASINTARSTELCIRSMRRWAGYPFSLTVGDGGSNDGSLEMLRTFESRGWLRLEVVPGGRSHAEWLDHWRAGCDAELAVFCDSDVEFRKAGWLRDLVAAASMRQAALVCAEMLPEARDFIEPVGGRRVRGAAQPAPWLLMIDPKQTSTVAVGFGFQKEETDRVPEGMIVYDVGSVFFRRITAAGLPWVVMPPSYRRKFHHYGGLSWIPLQGRRGRKKARDLVTVERRLQAILAGDPDGKRRYA